jgi:hypothetical protein
MGRNICTRIPMLWFRLIEMGIRLEKDALEGNHVVL